MTSLREQQLNSKTDRLMGLNRISFFNRSFVVRVDRKYCGKKLFRGNNLVRLLVILMENRRGYFLKLTARCIESLTRNVLTSQGDLIMK